ncbi:MAG: proline--tRNA ligase [Candidatus Berkelbacteria bacterium]|nr:proline--tRNA ligase [Candidatus Berkelbacteria bacterium]
MKASKYFLRTFKNVSDDEKIISAILLKRGAYIRESAAGRFYFLPLGQRVQQKIMAIIKEEMDSADAQEMLAPVLHPLELWKETNRTNTAGFELMKIKDRRGAEFALGGTAEEMFVDLVRQYDVSYRDLPFHLYQFSPKFRDEMRARGGLLRVREFLMKDGYSFDKDEESFKAEYEKMKKVYTNIFKKMGLETAIVEADNGYIGGEYCHEFIVNSEIGESKYFTSEDGSYSAHEDVAKFKKDTKNEDDEQKSLTEVEAVRGTTMQDGVDFHKLPLWQQIKDVMFVDEKNRFILAIIRGDFDVNEMKLKHLTSAATLRAATDEEIREVLQSEPGFISPVGIKEKIDSKAELIIVADDSLRTISNAYGGSNKKNLDLLNINIGRDYQPDIEGDIALAEAGFESAIGTGKLVEKRGIEVGNIFQLGYHYSSKMKGATYTDADGKEKPFYMGCYGIGIGRTMATLVEVYNNQKGIQWPKSVAPFAVEIISLNKNEEAEKLYQSLRAERGNLIDEVLYDDRETSAGEKFADADLVGAPIRIIVSEKSLVAGGVEIIDGPKVEVVEMEKVADLIK